MPTDDSIDSVAGAFPIDPSHPRLVGCGWDAMPWDSYDSWRVRSTSRCFIAEPDQRLYRGAAKFLFVLSLVYLPAIEYFIWRFIPSNDGRMLGSILAVLPGVALLAGSAVALWMGRKLAAKKPIFSYSVDDQQFQLPRIGRTIPRSQVVRLDLIRGGWLRSPYHETRAMNHPKELHAVIRLKSGTLVSLPLLGSATIISFKRGLGQAAQSLSQITGLPLERVNESSAFFDPYPAIRKQQKNEPVKAARANYTDSI